MSEPPRWTIRRTTAIVATSLLLLAVAGVPAWAEASIAPAEVEADTDPTLTLTLAEPGDENEEYGDTARVVVTAPDGFTDMRCEPTLGWGCAAAEDGTRVTFSRPVAVGDTYDLRFTVHTPVVNGTYEFRVTQADGPPSEEDPPATVSRRPAVTVTGGQDPEPEPTPTPTPTPKPPADDDGSQAGGSQTDTGGSTGGSGSPADDPTAADGDAGSDADSDDTSSTDTSTSGGSTAPRRTQGQASGTTLEIIPGEATDDDPDISAPDVADDPAIGRAGDTDDDSTAVAATGAQPSEEPAGPPWQQVVGAAMLLVGGAVVAIRRWGVAGRLRGLEPLELLRRWRGG